MIKKKILAIGMGCLIAMASAVPAFAAEKGGKDPAAKQARIEAKQEKQAENLKKLQERAAKLGVNIEGLTNKDARTKIKEAAEAKKEVRAEKLSEKASKLGVDINGLKNKEAAAKIKEARAAKKAAKTTKQGTITN